jgi:signal transduction histidine kinase
VGERLESADERADEPVVRRPELTSALAEQANRLRRLASQTRRGRPAAADDEAEKMAELLGEAARLLEQAAGLPPQDVCDGRETRPTLRRVDPDEVRLLPEEAVVPFHERAAIVASFRPQREFADAEGLRADYERLRAAYELSRAIGDERNPHIILERILDTALDFLAADGAVALLVDPTTAKPVPTVAKRRDPSGPLELSPNLVNHAAQKRTPVRSEDIDGARGLRSAMCVPMVSDGELIGVLYLDARRAQRRFDAVDLEVCATIAGHAATAVKNAALKADLRALEERRTESIRQLVSGASHFINNPLSVLRANLTMLGQWSETLHLFHAASRATDKTGKVSELLKTYDVEFVDAELGPLARDCVAAATRIEAIVDALQVFERTSEPDAREALDLIEVIEAALAEARGLVAVATVRRSLPRTARLVGVRDRLRELVEALLDNARRAIAPGAPAANTIAVTLQVLGTTIVLTIDDTGSGFAPGDVDKLFVPFFTTREDGALGLGLAVAAEIARQHGGNVRLEPLSPGTRCIVHLATGGL